MSKRNGPNTQPSPQTTKKKRCTTTLRIRGFSPSIVLLTDVKNTDTVAQIKQKFVTTISMTKHHQTWLALYPKFIEAIPCMRFLSQHKTRVLLDDDNRTLVSYEQEGFVLDEETTLHLLTPTAHHKIDVSREFQVLRDACEDNVPECPSLMLCPISHQFMTDPVVAPNGFTYERSAIEAWCQKNTWDRYHCKYLSTFLSQLRPNLAVKSLIQDWHDHKKVCWKLIGPSKSTKVKCSCQCLQLMRQQQLRECPR